MSTPAALRRVPGPAKAASVADPVLVSSTAVVTLGGGVLAALVGVRGAAPAILIVAALGLAVLAVRRTAASIFAPLLNHRGELVPLYRTAHRVPGAGVAMRPA